ncbi:autotransporter outer membrane beta-barrel domain-containing protein [Devosia neptuniae]|uniref:Autotransporter outer membrane beta-barrel domain-containing protein n=1 Tax=Devosia neptuniae TaxID=191302 RepID=A0ABY6CBT6_9HYPH|nr:autotransporter outer membrane beta-barrel domain-containing protein [Devosia neptuniae]UXN68577.1 autotransporter outer membrane beta-barrel domain-containing protein [Devosia neptuniae]
MQFDFASRNFDGGAKASGTGWLAGPYLTARLSDNLYLDLLAAGGQSSNTISPSGSYEDDFDATRYLLSAALQGQWSHDAWTFSPRAQLSYFEETSDGYADSLGVSIPAVTAGLGQLAVGPGIGYRLTLDNGVVVDLGLRAEGVLDIAGGSELGELQGRLSGTVGFGLVGFGLVGGANIGLSARLDGIGSGEDRSSVGVRLSLPAR